MKISIELPQEWEDSRALVKELEQLKQLIENAPDTTDWYLHVEAEKQGQDTNYSIYLTYP